MNIIMSSVVMQPFDVRSSIKQQLTPYNVSQCQTMLRDHL